MRMQATGLRISRKRVARLMHQQACRTSSPTLSRTTDSRHSLPVAPNLLARRLPRRRHEQGLGHGHHVRLDSRGLALPGSDHGSVLPTGRRLVHGENIDTNLCLRALEMAIQSRRPPPGLIHHSDRGSQYASAEYRRLLTTHGLVCSMSRKGDCWDNAVAESLWSTIKTELDVIQAMDFPARDAPGVRCSSTSRASTTHIACTRLWATSAPLHSKPRRITRPANVLANALLTTANTPQGRNNLRRDGGWP